MYTIKNNKNILNLDLKLNITNYNTINHFKLILDNNISNLCVKPMLVLEYKINNNSPSSKYVVSLKNQKKIFEILNLQLASQILK